MSDMCQVQTLKSMAFKDGVGSIIGEITEGALVRNVANLTL